MFLHKRKIWHSQKVDMIYSHDDSIQFLSFERMKKIILVIFFRKFPTSEGPGFNLPGLGKQRDFCLYPSP